jgi:nucleoside-triphosphatase THEP1
MKNKIYIVSESTHKCKTTMLWQWVSKQHNIGGFITPDVNNKRMLVNLASGETHELQISPDIPGIAIGRFNFSNEAFKTAQQWITDCISNKYSWFIIDEVGRLELDEARGLEPALSHLINYFKANAHPTRIILVIRNYLLNKALKHYQITHFEILDRTFFIKNLW